MTPVKTLEDVSGVQRDVALSGLTTYRFGGPARFYMEVEDEATLIEVLSARAGPGGEPMPLLVLGRGSNVVVSDSGFDGLVLRLTGEFLETSFSDRGEVSAGGAVPLPGLARRCARAGRGGLEWCVGIPGSVGGAVRMNAGGHGSDTSEWLISAVVLDARSLRTEDLPAPLLDLGYRSSNLTPEHVVVRAVFRTIARDRETSEQMLRDITRWRREHQPGGTLNAGSVFKNPPGETAGRMIDALGLKGLRVGGASVSPRHANFFEADRDASAQDVYDLVWTVQREVHRATGIRLIPELRFVGDFRVPAGAQEGEPA